MKYCRHVFILHRLSYSHILDSHCLFRSRVIVAHLTSHSQYAFRVRKYGRRPADSKTGDKTSLSRRGIMKWNEWQALPRIHGLLSCKQPWLTNDHPVDDDASSWWIFSITWCLQNSTHLCHFVEGVFQFRHSPVEFAESAVHVRHALHPSVVVVFHQIVQIVSDLQNRAPQLNPPTSTPTPFPHAMLPELEHNATVLYEREDMSQLSKVFHNLQQNCTCKWNYCSDVHRDHPPPPPPHHHHHHIHSSIVERYPAPHVATKGFL